MHAKATNEDTSGPQERLAFVEKKSRASRLSEEEIRDILAEVTQDRDPFRELVNAKRAELRHIDKARNDYVARLETVIHETFEP